MEVFLKLPNSDSLGKEETVGSVGSEDCFRQETIKLEIRSTKSEMMEMKEENEKLKSMLEEIETDYKSLKLRFSDTIHHRSDNLKNPIEIIQKLDELFDRERDFVSLSLGRGRSSSPTNPKKSDQKLDKSRENEELAMADLTLGFGESDNGKGLLGFGLEEKKNEKDEMGSEEETQMKERNGEKRMMGDGEEDGHPQSHVKRARVCVRARCETPTMNDGCQWRKYGQKISKGNPCPRAYYRCTVAAGCPVRKQVQRCIDDMSILITTYEGSHNHPLAISATAMASTTAAAATMLRTGSSSTPAAIPGTTTDNGSSKFNLYTKPAFNFPPTATTTFSPLHQTVTLDLTAPTHTPTTTSLDFSKFSTVRSLQRSSPSTSFDFSSSSAINDAPSGWSRGNSNQSNVFPYGQVRFGSSLLLEKQAIQDQSFTETLIKTIASDPSFRSAIATAINSAKVESRNGEEAAARPDPSRNLPFSSD